MAVPALSQDFIGLKISIFITLSTPSFNLPFNPLRAGFVTRVVGPGGRLIVFFRDLTVSFSNLH
jgi:hypothetical protein